MLYLVDYLANHKNYIDEVAQLKFTQWLHTASNRPYEIWLSEIKESAQTDAPPLTFIALCDTGSRHRDLAGFVTLVQMPENVGVENSTWMVTLYVESQYRKKGIGTHLMQRCIKENQRWEHTSLHLWTESKALTSFYAKRGWKVLGTDQQNGEDVMVYYHKKF